MQEESNPVSADRHATNRGQRRNAGVAVPVKRDVVGDKPWSREIDAVIAAHRHLAAEDALQHGVHLAVAKRPEEEHQVHTDEQQANDNRNSDAAGPVVLFSDDGWGGCHPGILKTHSCRWPSEWAG